MKRIYFRPAIRHGEEEAAYQAICEVGTLVRCRCYTWHITEEDAIMLLLKYPIINKFGAVYSVGEDKT